MHKLKLVNWAERRIKRRHKAPDLRISIQPIGFRKFFSSSQDVKCLDINRYGMAIRSRRPFKSKERISIDFRGKYISLSNVVGMVTVCTKVRHHYRISVVFTYAQDSKEYCRKTDNALSRIESLYNQEAKQAE
jgi:transposase